MKERVGVLQEYASPEGAELRGKGKDQPPNSAAHFDFYVDFFLYAYINM